MPNMSESKYCLTNTNTAKQIQILSDEYKYWVRQIQILVLSEDARSGGAGRRTQLQRPLELKARAAECSCCQLFYMDERATKWPQSYKIYEHRLVLRWNL